MENFDKIYELYAADVYHYALSLCMNETEAKDILQNTMLKAFTHYDKFRGECSVKTWLFGIAKNEFLNNAKRADNNNLPLENASNAFENDIEHKFGDRFQALEIHKLLHNLDDPYKEIFTLRVFAELKFADIGDIFGKSENWARVTFYRAKEKIIQLIKSETEE